MRVPGSDLDLRLVGYFTVVAEHANFGRAAAVLHVAQPSLSRQIQRLEDHLGVRLFDRTPQGSRLTEAGRAFLPRVQAPFPPSACASPSCGPSRGSWSSRPTTAWPARSR